MAKVKNQDIPVREFSYTAADGTDHYFGEFYRDVLGEGYLNHADETKDIVGRSRRGERPTEKGLKEDARRRFRRAFRDCTQLWNSLPEKSPLELTAPFSSKEAVWAAKLDHGIVCSYYDLWMRCCINHAKNNNGAMPEGECFPYESGCDCEEITIGCAKKTMLLSETQDLVVVGADEGCSYAWKIESGGGSLSSSVGGIVIYQAPSSNVDCLNNATISLSVNETICDTVAIAINGVLGDQIAYSRWDLWQSTYGGDVMRSAAPLIPVHPCVYSDVHQRWYTYDSYRAIIGNYNCSDNLISETWIGYEQSSGWLRFQDLCETTNRQYCMNDIAAIHLSAGGYGYSDIGSTIDKRSPAAKTQGCCPAGLIGF